jgi:hypothetical protein
MKYNISHYGEKYRKLGFIPDEYGNDVGCYSTFKIAPSFKNITQTNRKHRQKFKNLLQLLLFQDTETTIEDMDISDIPHYSQYMIDIIKYGQFYYSKKLDLSMAYYWDGDGTLVFIDKKGRVFINPDCKKDYNWVNI